MAERRAWVRVFISLSGGRHDGRVWPPLGPDGSAELDVPEWEMHDLVRAHHAEFLRWAEDPAEAAPEPVTVVSEPSATAAGPTGQSGQFPGQSVEEQEQQEVLVPAPSALRQDWVAYAISQGEDAETAGRMTKADLMSKHGTRLLCCGS
jgi:hypothetical protein